MYWIKGFLLTLIILLMTSSQIPELWKYKYAVCYLVMRQPVQIMGCGHRFCKFQILKLCNVLKMQGNVHSSWFTVGNDIFFPQRILHWQKRNPLNKDAKRNVSQMMMRWWWVKRHFAKFQLKTKCARRYQVCSLPFGDSPTCADHDLRPSVLQISNTKQMQNLLIYLWQWRIQNLRFQIPKVWKYEIWKEMGSYL